LKSCGTQAQLTGGQAVADLTVTHTKENNYAFVCLNIENILLKHKYTQHTQCRRIKTGTLKMQFVCIFFLYLLNICRKFEFL